MYSAQQNLSIDVNYHQPCGPTMSITGQSIEHTKCISMLIFQKETMVNGTSVCVIERAIRMIRWSIVPMVGHSIDLFSVIHLPKKRILFVALNWKNGGWLHSRSSVEVILKGTHDGRVFDDRTVTFIYYRRTFVRLMLARDRFVLRSNTNDVRDIL